MVYPPTPRSEFFAALAAEILHNYARGRVLVAVDGISGSHRFADDLSVALREAGHPVFRASLDDFLRPRAERTRHGGTGQALYDDWYDYSAFLRVLVQPFKLGGSTGFVTALFDAERDVARESRWVTAPQDAILLVDGPFAQRPELRGTANFVAYLDPDIAALESQAAAANALYEAAVGPRQLAHAIIGAATPADVAAGTVPKRLFADRC